MEFNKAFYNWVNKNLSAPQANAYCFNLVENGGRYFVELIGTEEFDSEDEDWACDDCFRSNPNSLEIPLTIAGSNWESCLESMIDLAQHYLSTEEIGAKVLNQSKGIGIGFVDGNLALLKKT